MSLVKLLVLNGITGEGDMQRRGDKLKDCLQCVSWFLGCLNGREKWGDKAVTPNHRDVDEAGNVFLDGWWRDPSNKPVGDVRTMCDAFRWDPNPDRDGRAVSD